MLKELELHNFRGFKKHTVVFKKKTLLVGKNNAGKSTIIEALRLASLIISRYKTVAYKEPPKWVNVQEATFRSTSRRMIKGISPDIKGLLKQYNTIPHRYDTEEPTYFKVTFEGGQKIELFLNQTEEIFAVLSTSEGKIISTPTQAKENPFPIISVLPQIGPLSLEEKVITENYLKRSELLPVTSLHFRNKIFNNKKMLDDFNIFVQTSWKGLQIKSIDKDHEGLLQLLVRDNNFAAEIVVMGHGLQMWFQMLWFIFSSSAESATLIIDEPDVYLHADLQKKLYDTLEEISQQTIVASHSFEFIVNTDPKNIVIIEKSNNKSQYANTLPKIEEITKAIGHSANLALTKYAATHKVLVVEGATDTELLNCFSCVIQGKITFDELPLPFKLGSRSEWQKVKGMVEITDKSSEGQNKVYCVLDRDFYLEKEISEKEKQAKEWGVDLCIWGQKEIENYLIDAKILHRETCKEIKRKHKEDQQKPTEAEIQQLIEAVLCDYKESIIDSFADQFRKEDFKLEPSTCYQMARRHVEERWTKLEGRISICPGKKVLSAIKEAIQKKYKVSFDNKMIAKSFKKEELHSDIKGFLERLLN